MAEIELLSTLGQVAGIGGIALGVVLLVFRDILAKASSLLDEQAYRLHRLAMVLTFAVGVIGLCLYAFAPPPNQNGAASADVAAPVPAPSVRTEGNAAPVIIDTQGDVNLTIGGGAHRDREE